MITSIIYPAFLSFQEITIILVIAVVIFGPDKIPEIARGLGLAVRKLKDATEDLKQEILHPLDEIDPNQEIRNSLKDLDPTKDIERSLEDLNPMNDLKKTFADIDPTADLKKSLSDIDPTKDIEATIEDVKSATEIETEKTLNSGGSISR